MSFDVSLPGARVTFTTREGGVSEGPYESLNLGILTDDDPDRVIENRRRAASGIDLGLPDVAMGWQVHGTDVLEWDRPPADGYNPHTGPSPAFGNAARAGAELPRVDGHATSAPGVGLLVLVADCLPVALASADRVAMLHCGWRGLAGGIVERAMEAFDGREVSAAVGPGIGSCCYEVGDEVLAEFAGIEGVASGRMLDLRAVAQAKLEAAGIGRVEHVDLCTSCNPELFFSHRRDNGVTGRQGGLVRRDA